MTKKILVVDDEPNVLKVVSSRLKANGFEIITAANGEEGLMQARKALPDLILLDISMPKMNGHEVLKKLKKDNSTKAIPVIMLTGRTETDEVVKSVADEGALDYILKPFMASSFLKQINNALKERVPEDACEQDMLDLVEKKIKKALENKKEK